jgi:ribosome-binding protein aMBF1 (putative translation factor)
MAGAVFSCLKWHTAVVLTQFMSDYATALETYLAQDGNNQADLAEKVGCTQATISRYAAGVRLPARDLAKKIDEATNSQVPLALWIAAATKKFGLAA